MLLAPALFAFAALIATPAPRADSAAQDTFTRFVDEYLDRFARRHPSIAAGNGIHSYDDRLEDFSAASVAAEIADLRRDRARLDALDTHTLTPDERVDHRILGGLIDAWLLDLDAVQTWRRNPMIYAAAISDGVHDLMTMESDAADARLRRIASKLRAVPALLASAHSNVTHPPRVFAEHGIGMLEGIPAMLDHDIPLAFASVHDDTLWAAERAAAATAKQAIATYVGELKAQLPMAGDDFAIGAKNLAARYKAEELIDLPVERLLAIGQRELAKAQNEFRATARQIDSTRPPMAVWGDVLHDHPARGAVVPAAERAVNELIAFGDAKQLLTLPSTERPTVAAAPPFDIGLASMHSSPPLEAHPVKSFYYVTDASADWPPAQQDAWLQHLNYANLAIVSAHEVYPGHWAHSLYMRRTPGKIRRVWIGLNPFPQPSSGQDGWAHYAEQLVIEQGFHADQPKYHLAQVSEALTRICRLIVGIQLHTRGMTVAQGTEFFQTNAYLPAPAAEREAARGSYDPTYGVYVLGKMGALKLRKDYAAKMGDRFNLREFHERVMTDGIAPWWAHRQLLLPGDTAAVIE